MEKFCNQHIHGQHLKDSKPYKNPVGDLQQKHPFQDQILVITFSGCLGKSCNGVARLSGALSLHAG